MDKKTTILVIVLLVAVAAGGAWVYAATKSASPEPTHTHDDSHEHNHAEGNTATSDPSKVASVTITATDDGFMPSNVTVKKGQSVKVVNSSSSSIEFSSADHPTHLRDPELNMSTLKPGESGTVTPGSVGKHGYHDHLHADHTGSIAVTE